MIDLSLHSQLFRVYCYCINLDHILALVIVVLGGYYWPLQLQLLQPLQLLETFDLLNKTFILLKH